MINSPLTQFSYRFEQLFLIEVTSIDERDDVVLDVRKDVFYFHYQADANLPWISAIFAVARHSTIVQASSPDI